MGMFNQNQGQGHSRGGGPPIGSMNMSGGRGGFIGGRGGNNNQGGRGRGGPMMNRGGGRGRGNGSYNNMGGRGGGVGQNSGSFRGHGSNRGFGNRDNRRGGSFSGGGNQGYSQGFQHQPYQHQHQHHHNHPHHHQQNYNTNNSFRGRNQGFPHSSRGGRHDSGSFHAPKENGNTSSSNFTPTFSSGKKDENRRTLTDFKIVGLEIPELTWNWNAAKSDAAETAVKVEAPESALPHTEPANTAVDQDASPAKAEDTTGAGDAATAAADVSAESALVKTESVALVPPPPSRVRIYFHTPVTADDAHPLPSHMSYSPSPSAAIRKGKRKKLEDDDGDYEDGRGPPPPPPHSSGMGADHDGSVAPSVEYNGSENVGGRGSVAPSVADTVSDGDWLMAAIGGDDGQDDGDDHDYGNDGDQYHDADAEGDYGKPLVFDRDCARHERAARSNDSFAPLIPVFSRWYWS